MWHVACGVWHSGIWHCCSVAPFPRCQVAVCKRPGCSSHESSQGFNYGVLCSLPFKWIHLRSGQNSRNPASILRPVKVLVSSWLHSLIGQHSTALQRTSINSSSNRSCIKTFEHPHRTPPYFSNETKTKKDSYCHPADQQNGNLAMFVATDNTRSPIGFPRT